MRPEDRDPTASMAFDDGVTNLRHSIHLRYVISKPHQWR
jgi:hypothetical protein